MKNMEETKTPYEWCVEYNIRVLDLKEWPVEYYGSKQKHYFEMSFVGRDEFLELISSCTVKPNSQPRKSEEYLEWRMYGLVPYNISPIQAGIQFGHAVQEFNNLMICGESTMQSVNFDNELLLSNLIGFNKWRRKDKTFIILNGGTTNDSIDDKWYGSLQKSRDILYENDVLFSEFYEPDLNNALTAVVFLVDERVFNRVTYPNFEKEVLPWSKTKPSEKKLKELEERNAINYGKWVEKIGGPKNAFFREFLSKFKLAN
jgi:hypothetical protein